MSIFLIDLLLEFAENRSDSIAEIFDLAHNLATPMCPPANAKGI